MSLKIKVSEEELNTTIDMHFETLDLATALFYNAQKLDDFVTSDGKIAFSAHGYKAYEYFTKLGRDFLRCILYMSEAYDNWVVDFYHWDGKIVLWQKYVPKNAYVLAVVDNHTGNIFEEFRAGLNAFLLFDFDGNLWSEDYETTGNTEEISG